MLKFLPAYAATAIAMVAIDLLWLGVVARPLYQQGIGHLMAERPNLVAAGAFYLLYPLGLLLFAVMPQAASSGWMPTAVAAAGLGFFAYATYDLTNLATLKNWPVGLALLDMAWGSALSAVSALAGRYVLERSGGG